MMFTFAFLPLLFAMVGNVWQHEINFVIAYIFKLFFFLFSNQFSCFWREAQISASKIAPIDYSRRFNSINYLMAFTKKMIESFFFLDEISQLLGADEALGGLHAPLRSSMSKIISLSTLQSTNFIKAPYEASS